LARRKRTCRWFKAEGANLVEVSRFVRDWLCLQEGYRDSRKERYLVELAVIEACTNIVRYAYPGSSPGNLGVCLERAGDSIEILLFDEGVPFDPTGVCPPDLHQAHEGGYGIFLMRTIMGSVAYGRRGSRWNCLRLVREVPRGTVGGNGGEGLEGLRRRIVSGKEKVR
jgi:anti-sigma regulatory factor (Ser/Thr protein kinase)